MKTAHRRMLVDLLTLPTAPFNEGHIAAYIRDFAAGRKGLTLATDDVGNLRLRLRIGKPGTGRPVLFSAHMDHPGFEAGRTLRDGRLEAIWRGGVLPEYFVGSRVRFYDGDRVVRGTIEAVRVTRRAGRRRVESATVRVPRPVSPGAIGMWNLSDPVIRGSRIFARGCDDIAGLAAILAAFDELIAARRPVDVYATFTRAEEVGFAGAIAACRNGFVPKKTRVIAVECSSELPGVPLGGGPILRVGDYSAIFSPGLTAFCRRVADDLSKRDRAFRYQRKLMDGGTCESAAFCAAGFEATGLCVALGNYHNMDRKRGKIAAEYIDLDDFAGLVKWFVALATSKLPFAPDRDPAFVRRLDELDRTWRPLLLRTAWRTRGS